MNLVLVLFSAGPALDLPPPPPLPDAVLAAAVTTYDAFVATEETPPTKDLLRPAIWNRGGRNHAILSPEGPVPIV